MKKLYIASFILAFILAAFFARSCNANPLVKIAISELGNGEEGSNNCGPDIMKYTGGKEVPWCAGFVSYVLCQAGYDCGIDLSAKSIYNTAVLNNGIITEPKPGDLISFWRENMYSWKGHIGIVEKVDNEYVYTIEGNVGKYPAKVKRFKYKKNSIPKFVGFVRYKQRGNNE